MLIKITVMLEQGLYPLAVHERLFNEAICNMCYISLSIVLHQVIN